MDQNPTTLDQGDLTSGASAAAEDLPDELAAAALAAGWRPPLPAAEVEWGWRSFKGEYFGMDNEARARRFVASCEGRARLACRELGPWTEVNHG